MSKRAKDPPELYLAARRPDALTALLDAGADPNAVTEKGETALGFCAAHGLDESAEILLARGADPSWIVPEIDYSILMFAAEDGHAAIVDLLLDAGADALFTNAHGTNALSVAIDHDRVAIARRILERCPALADAAAKELARARFATFEDELESCDARGWSAAHEGIRARVIARDVAPRAGVAIDIACELENVSAKTIAVPHLSPAGCAWTLRDARGALVEPRLHRTEIASRVGTRALAPAARLRDTLTMCDEGRPAALDLVSCIWPELARGAYTLEGEVRYDDEEGAWTAAMRPPPLAFTVR